MIHTASRVNSRDMMPAVEIRWDGPDQAGEMTPTEARTFALTVLETAEAAEHDSAMVRWLVSRMGLDVRAAVAALGELRAFRAPTEGEEL